MWATGNFFLEKVTKQNIECDNFDIPTEKYEVDTLTSYYTITLLFDKCSQVRYLKNRMQLRKSTPVDDYLLYHYW